MKNAYTGNLRIDTDMLRAFKRGVEDALIEQGMVHAGEYAKFLNLENEDFVELNWRNYHDGYEFGEYLHHVMSVADVEVMRE